MVVVVRIVLLVARFVEDSPNNWNKGFCFSIIFTRVVRTSKFLKRVTVGVWLGLRMIVARLLLPRRASSFLSFLAFMQRPMMGPTKLTTRFKNCVAMIGVSIINWRLISEISKLKSHCKANTWVLLTGQSTGTSPGSSREAYGPVMRQIHCCC